MTSSVEAFQLPHGDKWNLSYFRAWWQFHARQSEWCETTNPVGIDIWAIDIVTYPGTLHALPGDWVVKNGDKWEVRQDTQWGRKRVEESDDD